jgi:hypothetical protein
VFRKHIAKVPLADFFALLALAGTVGWFCDGMLLEGKVPFFRDLGTYSYPLKFSLAKSFQAGELALWDRHMATGFPLLAAFQPGVFYPPSLLFYLLPFFDAVRWTFLVHFLIAASGAYFLCRYWQCPTYISVIGALVFAFGGTTVSLSNLLNHFQTSVWLPWILLCGERYFNAASWKNFLILVVVLACALLAGSPEIYVFSLGLLSLDVIRLGAREGMPSIVRALVAIVAANLVVAAIGMAQFLPTLELLLQSRRDRPIPFGEASYWSLNPTSLIGLLLPDKEVDYSLPVGVRLFFARDIPLLLSHYLGVLALLGISAWAYFSSCKKRLMLLAVVFASLTLAFGSFTPVYAFLFEQIPLFRIVRFPEKFFFITYGLLLYAVVKGLVALHQHQRSETKFPILCLVALLLGLATAYSLGRLYPEMLSRWLSYLARGQAASPPTLASLLFGLERQMGVTVALLLIYFCVAKGLFRACLQHTMLILIVFFDVGTAHKPLQFLLDTAIVTNIDKVLPNADNEDGRVFYYTAGLNLHPSSLTVIGRPSFPKAVALSFENLLPNAGVLYGFDYFQEIDALGRQPYNDFLNFANLLPPQKRANFLRALNIRYVVAFQSLDLPGFRLVKQSPEHFSWLYEIDDAAPRVYVASRAVHEAQMARTLRMLASPDFDQRTQVLVNEEISLETGPALGGEAKIVQYSNNRVVVQAALGRSGILVLTDSYYPGWKVFVNGKAERMLRANYFFRGVRLPSGKHNIEFRYEPLSFTIGWIVSLLTTVSLIGISLARSVIRRKRRHQVIRAVPLGAASKVET